MNHFSSISTLYVSQKNGSDHYSGLVPIADGYGNGPLASLEYALQKVAELRQGKIMQPLSIQIMDSFYFVKNTIEIDESVFDVTIEPFENQSVTLIGGKRITGFQKDCFQGVSCFAAPIPEAADGSWIFTDLYVDGIRADLQFMLMKAAATCELNKTYATTPAVEDSTNILAV